MANALRSEISRRRFLALSALSAGTALGAGSLLEACSSGSATTGGSGTTTLTVMTIANTNGDLMAYNYIPQFQQLNPTIKVTVIPVDATRLNAMYAAGQPPDIVEMDGAPDMANTMARGLAAPLDDYIAKSSLIKASDLASDEVGLRWNGKTTGSGSLYGLGKDWSQDAMFWYNKKLFDQAHVPHPSPTEPLTYDEFLELGKKLTVRQGNTIQIYGLDPI